ncbi:turripeptide Lol9.1-like [Dreissena polymorpha]|uniref:Kazal-like domain-containing protein n=1 Tax=Dreissena polymorpha TaxID=45954 RepID=A0A9D4R8E0_DREPO|nr:turripeptide Lol9.1-like [Dreissena polymorpha]KAH3857537.1 hypothetical protein DPMN_100147 [Dreissena polymorpha]
MKLVCAILLCIFGAAVCLPKRFIDCTDFMCDEVYSPVCGTDGRTYANECQMDVENRKRLCWMGHFNMVSKVHEGPCSDVTLAP